MKRRKGFFGVWTVPIIFIITVTCAIVISHMLPHILEWLGYETRPIFTREKQHTIEQNTYDPKVKEIQMKLAPPTIIKIKAKCSCGYDFEPWKDDKTHMISHGLCVGCYINTMIEIGLRPKIPMVVSGIKRMVNAERWWSV